MRVKTRLLSLAAESPVKQAGDGFPEDLLSRAIATAKRRTADVTQLEVFGYDFRHRVYLYWGFNGRSVSTYTAASMDGDTVIWTGIDLSAENRCTEVFSSDATSSSDKCETSTGGGDSWVLRAEGKSTKLP